MAHYSPLGDEQKSENNQTQDRPRDVSRAATVPLSEGVAEPLGRAEISAAKARVAVSPGS
jgi:hypothetical protein